MAAEAEEDAVWGGATDDFLGCCEDRRGHEVVGLREVPAVYTFIARGVGEAGGTEVEAFGKDNGGVVMRIENGGVDEMVPWPWLEQGEIRG